MAFYRLSIDEGKRKKYAYGILLDEYPSMTICCDVCSRAWKKDLLRLTSRFNIALSNDHFPDFLGLMTLKAISEKTRQILCKHKITGFQLHRVDVIKKEDLSKDKLKYLRERGYCTQKFANSEIDYFYLDVGIGAELHNKTQIILKDCCDVCGYKDYRTEDKPYIDPFHDIFIKSNTWNGNDIFRVEELGNMVFCTEIFVNLCKDYKLTGINFDEIFYE